MVRNCCVIGCNVRSHDRQGKKLGNGLSFHSFPTWKQHEGAHIADLTKRRRLAWIAAVGRLDLQFSSISKYLLVCSRHFHSGNKIRLKDGTFQPAYSACSHHFVLGNFYISFLT
uniref:THAP domain-containing protein 1 n=1 Tax=Maylandia zebra TaxID=106582 RepID=A0A3P9B226_9CICH